MCIRDRCTAIVGVFLVSYFLRTYGCIDEQDRAQENGATLACRHYRVVAAAYFLSELLRHACRFLTFGHRQRTHANLTQPFGVHAYQWPFGLDAHPVSYTHLDVYKRQGLFQTKEEVLASGQPNARLGGLKYADLDGNGRITEADQTWIFNPVPAFSYGLNVALNYKGIDLSLSLIHILVYCAVSSGPGLYNHCRCRDIQGVFGQG